MIHGPVPHSRAGRAGKYEILGLALLIIAAILAVHSYRRSSLPQGARVPEDTDGPSSAAPHKGFETVLRETTERLIACGLSPDAARSVVELNARYFALVWEEDRQQWQRTVDLLARLGSQPEIQSGLSQIPELAGLLAGSMEARQDGPACILSTIPHHTEQRQAVLSLYALFCGPADSVKLADALRHDGDLILRLADQGALQLLSHILLTPADPDARNVYLVWVRDVLGEALVTFSQGDEGALDRAAAILDVHGVYIRDLLENDKVFRRLFAEKYWPPFAAALRKAQRRPRSNDPGAGNVDEQDIVWANYAVEPRVWNYFHELRDCGDVAFEVFDRWGALAVHLVLAPEYRDIRERVVDALRAADELVIEALDDDNLRSRPLFTALLKRNLESHSLAKALHELRASPADAPRKLVYWNTLSDTALAEELGPPPEGPKTWIPGYSLYYWVRKKSQGRETSTMDAVFAIADAAELLSIAAEVPVSITKIVGSRRAAMLAKLGIKEAAEATEKTVARGLLPMIARDASALARNRLREPFFKRVLQVDVTEAVRYTFDVFRRLGLGRKTFRALTGLEARVFMRNDRRILLSLPGLLRLQRPSVVGRLLRETMEAATVDLAANTSPGQAVIQTSVQQFEAWRQHLSLWWFAVNTGALDGDGAQGRTEGAPDSSSNR